MAPPGGSGSAADLAQDALGPTHDRFSAAPLGAVSATLGATGWFEGDPTVHRTGPASFIVEGEWRIPAAVVRWQDKDYLVSWDARRMPPVYDHDRARLPVILGSRVGPPTPTGEAGSDAWAGEGIGAALELIEVVSAQMWAYAGHGILASASAHSENDARNLEDIDVFREFAGHGERALFGILS